MAGGRPSTYTEQRALAICERIAAGLSLGAVCAELGIGVTTVYQWLDAKPEFAQMYARAREDQADHYADEIVAIADEVATVVQQDGEETTLALDATAIARNRLRIDARKWVAAKLRPRKYGERVQQEITGADGGPVQASIEVTFVGKSGK